MRFPVALLASLLFCSLTWADKESVEYSWSVSATPLQAYQAMVTDWQLRQWNGAAVVYTELRPGGTWRMTYPDGHTEEGTFVTVEPGRELSYTYNIDNTPTNVTVLFVRSPTGADIRYKQSGFGDDRDAARRRDLVTSLWNVRSVQYAQYLNGTPSNYIAHPAGAGPFPAVILLHDRFGLTISTRLFADSLAQQGYYTMAVDMFDGNPPPQTIPASNAPIVINQDDAVAAAERAYDQLRRDPNVIADRIATIGLGYGGSIALALAAEQPHLFAVVTWYGNDPLRDPSLYRRISCPVLTINGDHNVNQPRAEIVDFNHSLLQAGVHAESVAVQAAPRFADPAYGADYNPAAAYQAWRKTLAFLNLRLMRS